MPYRDPEYVQKKIELIEKGLPIDIGESELIELESSLKGACDFYVDLLVALLSREKSGENVGSLIIEENKNIACVAIALRKISDFRLNHWSKIKGVE